LRLISGFLVGLSALLLGGCYGFAGGGLPPAIKTVAVLPFDNQTPEPTLTQEISRAVREAVEQRLGLRQASEARADAVVRGSITFYDPDLPVAYESGEDRDVNVTRREVQITVSVEILDQRQGKPLWQRSGLVVRGAYDPPREAEGRQRALDDLVVNIVEGAQSQW
jgi:Lipopolysaccharide-assembly